MYSRHNSLVHGFSSYNSHEVSNALNRKNAPLNDELPIALRKGARLCTLFIVSQNLLQLIDLADTLTLSSSFI